MNRTVRVPAALVLGLLAAAALAQPADPTRPPNATSDAMPAGGTGPQLQAVLHSRGRRVAVIDGAHYLEGAKVGDAVVARIGEAEVTLRRGAERETLRLSPQAVKRMVRRAPEAGAPAREGTGK